MEKITAQTLKEKKGAIILIAILFVACVYVFWPKGDGNPPPPPPGSNQAATQPDAPAGTPTPGKTAGAPAPPPAPPPRKISTGSS
jgi:hypothetical protein